MIKYFVFIIIIILLFILISCLFNLKEKFELNEVKNNQNTLKKLDLHDESIYYQKGEVGIGGEKGRRGDTGESGLDGARGEQGQNGVNGNNYGNIIFEDSYGHEIDRIPPYYSESNSITPIASDIKIIIPDGKQGPDGLIPPIKFYKEDKSFDQKINLSAGDIILLKKGSHGFEIQKDCEFIEIKQGPYLNDKDKVRF